MIGSNAQLNADTIYKKYSTGLLYRMGGSLMKGNQKITFRELSKEFSMSDIGLDQYIIAKKKLTIGRIFLYTGVACGIVAGYYGPRNKNLGYGLLAAQMVSLTISFGSTGAGNRFLDQAIQIRNKDYLFPGPH